MTTPNEIDDNDPRLPSASQIDEWFAAGATIPERRSWHAGAAALYAARKAAKHVLAQADKACREAIERRLNLIDKEKREAFVAGWRKGVSYDTNSPEVEALRRYPDPMPEFAERFQVGDEHFRRSSDGRVERAQYTDGRRPSWAPLTEAERTALKALAEGL